MNRVILDLCGGTGSWSRPYREAGYDVRLITLPEHDVRSYRLPDEPIYGILAAPPCTEFSKAKGNNYRDFDGGMEIVRACLRIIWEARIRHNLKFWALENPEGFLRQFLGKPPFKFQPWQFGDMKTKATDIWGYFNFPKVKISERPDEVPKLGHQSHTSHPSWTKPVCPPEYAHLKLNRAAIRAITPPGFAKAFMEANK